VARDHMLTIVITVFMLPFPLLKELQLNKRQIWGLIATFSLGIITICMSVVRFATIEAIQAWTNVCTWLLLHLLRISRRSTTDTYVDVLSMAEMAVAIMVVSLPAMRSFLRRGGIFSSNKKAAYSSSRPGYGLRTSIVVSSGVKSIRSKHNTQVQIDDDSGSEVELNTMGRTDVIYATRRVSVQFSNTEHDRDHYIEEAHRSGSG